MFFTITEKKIKDWEKEGNLKKLIKALGNKDSMIRSSAASALGRLGDQRAIEPLIGLLQDQDIDVRSYATFALVELGDQRAVEHLISLLGHQGFSMHRRAIRLLGKVGGERAIEPLINVAEKDDDPEMKYCVAEALAEIGDERAVELLIILLHGEDSTFRALASTTLGQIGDTRAVESLVTAALKDQDLSVRGAAKEALVAALKNQNPDVRKTAAEALGEIGYAQFVDPLVAVLGDKDGGVQQAVAKTLVKMGYSLAGSMSCPRCLTGLQWWFGERTITIDLSTRERHEYVPHNFAGACSICRKVFCSEHADGSRCPTCGRALSTSRQHGYNARAKREICWCGGTYRQVGGEHKLVMHEKRDPRADPTGHYACADCGKPLKGSSSMVAHGPCVRLVCEHCGHELSNTDSRAVLRRMGYRVQD